MTKAFNRHGSLTLNIISHGQAEMVLKQFELLNEKLKLVTSIWFDKENIIVPDIEPGLYVVRLSLTSGVQQDEVVQIKAGEEKLLLMDFSEVSPYETHEWAYFSKSLLRKEKKSPNAPLKGRGHSFSPPTASSLPNTDSGDGGMISFFSNPESPDSSIAVSCRLMTFKGGAWETGLVPSLENLIITEDGENFILDINNGMHVLELKVSLRPNLLVCLPPSPHLHGLIKLAQGMEADFHDLDITLSTTNWEAEAMLALLTKGAMRDAKTLMNAETAERLLYLKHADPIAAAIGGYFLLKISDYKRLHDWANNLANYFSWMPDGCVIHAWQLMHEQKNNAANTNEIKRRLLGAVKRGIPFFTEGLRLLYEGLTMLSFNLNKQDIQVEQALGIIRNFVTNVDWSQPNTTFTSYPFKAPNKDGLEAILGRNI